MIILSDIFKAIPIQDKIHGFDFTNKGNLCMCRYGSEHILSYRQFDYIIDNGQMIPNNKQPKFGIVKIDSSENFIFEYDIHVENIQKDNLEDARFVNWNGNIFMNCTYYKNRSMSQLQYLVFKVIPNDITKIVVLELIYSDVTNKEYISKYTNSTINKNWIGLDNLPFTYICKTNQNSIILYNILSKITEQRTVNLCDNYHGSCYVQNDENSTMVLCHKKQNYNSVCILSNNQFSSLNQSKEFRFSNKSVEFCCYSRIQDGNIEFIYTSNDKDTFYMNIKKEDFVKLVFSDDQEIPERLIRLMIPYDINDYTKIRVGREFDGGYIVAKELIEDIKYIISGGINDDISFEEHFHKLNGQSSIIAYDPTINSLPPNTIQNNMLQWKKQFINRENNIDKITYGLKNILLKLDIEGSEFQAFGESYDFNNISMLVIEIHWITDKHYHDAIELLNKIERSMTLFHIHANNNGGCSNVFGYDIPNVVELTFINNSFIKTKKISRQKYPIIGLDKINDTHMMDIPLDFIQLYLSKIHHVQEQ